MAINKKLIHFTNKTDFNSEVAKGNILDHSIVFIKDTQEIYTHKTYYGGTSLLFWGNIKNKPTNLSQFNDDVVAGNYLPLSGGTLTGRLLVTYSPTSPSEGMIAIDSSSASKYPTIRFDGNCSWGYLGFSAANTPTYFDNSFKPHTLIHSGNIGSQIVEGITTHVGDATNANGDIAKLNSYYSSNGFRISRFNGLNGLGTKNSDGLIVNWPLDGSYGQQWYIDDESHTIQTRYVSGGAWSDWKTIAFTDSNVASATKATQDGSGKVIADTYAVKDEVLGYEDVGGSVEDAVEYLTTSEQNLSDAEKERVKTNIGVNVPIVEHGTSNSTFALTPNKYHRWGTMSSLTLTLASPNDTSVVNNYAFEFTSGGTATTLLVPSSIQWVNDITVEAGKRYQGIVNNGVGVLVSVSNE